MSKKNRTRGQILADKLERLRQKREDRIDRYILPVETEIEEVKE